ncbi:CDP-alcohol phosphatidyltransferase family protein [Streptomyces sp. NPDC048142]|uniref:CDP-alcohol phosphatidyltransferase family protein n=1 Tax=Streptomyces sp. NPDC048142 TaxID=3365501 RepID=UPI00371DACE6
MPVSDLADSRAATDALLHALKAGRWRPRAIAAFLAVAADRSLTQAALRPRALGQLTALHSVLFAAACGRGGRNWVAASWTVSILHLGLLEDRDRLALADVLTLIRGNLPALPAGSGPRSGLMALALDMADGRIARRQGTVTPFGDYADTFADAAFWTWFTLRREPHRTIRAAAVAAWVLPVVAVTATGVRRGRMPQRPRPALLRPAAAMQVLLAVRHLKRHLSAPSTATPAHLILKAGLGAARP